MTNKQTVNHTLCNLFGDVYLPGDFFQCGNTVVWFYKAEIDNLLLDNQLRQNWDFGLKKQVEKQFANTVCFDNSIFQNVNLAELPYRQKNRLDKTVD